MNFDQSSLAFRGATLMAFQVRLSMWRNATGDANAWPSTPEQLQAADLQEASVSDLEALKELDQRDGTENEEELEKEIQSRVFQLIKGGGAGSKNQGLPKAPSNLGALMEQDPLAGDVDYSDQDAKYWQKQYPQLDLETARALLEHADEYPDQYPKHVLVGIGAYFVDQNWTVSKLQQWCSSFSKEAKKTNLTSKERAELYGTLAYRVLTKMYTKSNHIGEMLHQAKLLQVIPLADLKRDLQEAGGNVSDGDDDDKASVIVALIQHMYADLLPSSAKPVDDTKEPHKKKHSKRQGKKSTSATAKHRRT